MVISKAPSSQLVTGVVMVIPCRLAIFASTRYFMKVKCRLWFQREDYQQLFEQFSPALVLHTPKELIDLWKQYDIDPKILIPSLVTLTQTNKKSSIECAISYLEHCVFKLKNEDLAIHNYLISLYCKMDDEAPLLRYLNDQGDVSPILF